VLRDRVTGWRKKQPSLVRQFFFACFTNPTLLSDADGPPRIVVSRQDGVHAQLLEGIGTMLGGHFRGSSATIAILRVMYGSNGEVSHGFAGRQPQLASCARGLWMEKQRAVR